MRWATQCHKELSFEDDLYKPFMIIYGDLRGWLIIMYNLYSKKCTYIYIYVCNMYVYIYIYIRLYYIFYMCVTKICMRTEIHMFVAFPTMNHV